MKIPVVTKHKKLLGGLAVLSLVSCLYILSNLSFSQKDITTSKNPTPSPSSQNLKVVNVTPPEGNIPILFPKSAIAFLFNQKISLNQVIVSVSPSINYKLELDPNPTYLYLMPLTPWKSNVPYTITIKSPSGNTIHIHRIVFYEPTTFEDLEVGDPPDTRP